MSHGRRRPPETQSFLTVAKEISSMPVRFARSLDVIASIIIVVLAVGTGAGTLGLVV